MDGIMLEHEKRITEVEQKSKSLQHRVSEVEKRQEILMEMNANIKLLAEQNKTQNESIKSQNESIKMVQVEIKEVKTVVSDLEKRPLQENSDNYKKIKMQIAITIITGIVSVFLGYILGNLK